MTSSVTIPSGAEKPLPGAVPLRHMRGKSRQPEKAMLRTFLNFRSLFAAGLALALPQAAMAAPDGKLRQLELSGELYAVGLAENDPLFLLASAKLRRMFDFQPIEGSGARGRPMTWQAILDTARDMAFGDASMLAMIDDLAGEGARGVTTGQVYSIAEIGIGGLDVYDPMRFEAGQYAEVYVEAAGGIDLNVYVYDAQGNLVCADTDPSPISYCGWRPAEAGEFTIKVENKGDEGSAYALMTN